MNKSIKLRFAIFMLALLVDLVGQYVWQARISLSLLVATVLLIQANDYWKLIMLTAVGVLSGWWFGLATLGVIASLVSLGLASFLQNRVPKLLQAILVSSGFISGLVVSFVVWQIGFVVSDLVGWFVLLVLVFLLLPVTMKGNANLQYAI